MYEGTESPVSVSNEKAQANQDRVFFKHLDLFPTKKNVYSLKIYTIFKMGAVLKCNFGKVYTFLQEIRCLKKIGSGIFTKYIGLCDFKLAVWL